MLQAANAPLAQPVHLRERWNECTNIWNPRTQNFNLELSEYGWASTSRNGALVPTPQFAELVYRSALAGQVSVVLIPEKRTTPEPGGFGSNLLSFHNDLARVLSEKVLIETGDVSFHARQFAPDGSFNGTGFRTQYSKILPPHYDLALYYREDQRVYMPAHVTLIAWGNRGDARKEVTNYFFDVQSLHEEKPGAPAAGMPLRTLAPAIYAFNKDAQILSESNVDYRFPVSIPEGAITIFPNRGLAHGAEYATFQNARALNRHLSLQDKSNTTADPDNMVPIDVLLL